MKLVFCATPHAIGNSCMTGLGLRMWELALAASAHAEVSLLVDAPVDDLPLGAVEVVVARDDWLDELRFADAVFFNDQTSPELLLTAYEAGAVIVSETTPPIEQLEYESLSAADDPEREYLSIRRRFLAQLLLSDRFSARSEIERATLVSALVTVGRLGPGAYRDSCLTDLVSLIPIGFGRFSSDRAEAFRDASPRWDLVWNGGLWKYFDASALVRALGTGASDERWSIMFMYEPPPETLLPGRDPILREADALGAAGLVQFPDTPIDHLDRDAVVSAALTIACVARDGVENHTCVRLRLRDAFLYRKPILVDAFGATAELVRRLGIGAAVDTRDAEAVRAAVRSLCRDSHARAEIVAAYDRVRGRYCLDGHVERLVGALAVDRAGAVERRTAGFRDRAESLFDEART